MSVVKAVDIMEQCMPATCLRSVPQTNHPASACTQIPMALNPFNHLYSAVALLHFAPAHLPPLAHLAADMPRIVGDGIDVVDVAVMLHQIDGMFRMMKETLDILFESDGGTKWHQMALGIAFATEKINLARLVRGFATELANGHTAALPGVGQGG